MIMAIIDMGTNTFNLLVANQEGEILHESKLPVKLGEGGFRSVRITPDAQQRALAAFETHMSTAKRFGATRYFAFATSMVRDAANGAEVTSHIKKRFNVDVEVISGEREAELIWKGVRAAAHLGENPTLVVDIGGGSNETIIADSRQIFWLSSFNLGVTRLTELFTISDPIKPDELLAIEEHMLKTLQPLLHSAQLYRPRVMAGSSGSFESFRRILEQKVTIPKTTLTWAEIPLREYLQLHQFFITSTHEQRFALPGLDPIRIDLIVPATIFVNLLVKQLGIAQMLQSDYALKEGFLMEIINA